jgi:hypothetical protein
LRTLDGESIDSNVIMQHMRQLRVGLEAISDLPAEDNDIRLECEKYLIALEELAASLSC